MVRLLIPCSKSHSRPSNRTLVHQFSTYECFLSIFPADIPNDLVFQIDLLISLASLTRGEISVICQDVKLLKEKFDNRVSLTKSISSSQTSSCASFMRSLVLETPSERFNEVLETSNNNNKSPEAAASSMNEEKKDDRRELLEDGWEWDIFDKETEL